MGSTLQLIGQRLRQARQSVGYTQEEVSQKLGITRDDLSLFESGRKSPPISLLRKLAKLYGVFVSYFYGIDKLEGEGFTLLLEKAKELSLPPETISQLQRFTFLCGEIAKLRQKLGIPKPEIPQAVDSKNLVEFLESKGIPVIRMPLDKNLFSAMVYDENSGACILVNSGCSNLNQLVACEYAHILQGEKVHLNVAKANPTPQSKNSMPVSKVLWELVLTALKQELISTSYAGDVLGISPMEVEEALLQRF
ncbi:MAG: helix-turn-helix transcriptional regulator [Thermocrinis sp.]|nr:helix-turn-helix transcriptional regulator [Thermocrinis sp.]